MDIKSSILLLTLFISPIVVAENTTKNSERSHYKCHLSLSDESVVVHRFVSVDKTQTEFESELAERVVFGSDGVTAWKIVNIYECVQSKQSFSSKEARELEAQTPY